MNTKKNSEPEIPAAAEFYSLSNFSSGPAGLSPLVPARKGSNPLLRLHAEEALREMIAQSQEHIDDLSPESLRVILHELRVHQIELEMQNEELRRAQAELDASRARYFDLYDLAPVGYCTVGEKGLILEGNLTAAALLGVARSALVRQLFSRFVLKEDQDIYYMCRRRLTETGEPQQCELRLVRPDGPPFWSCLEATASHDEAGAPSCRIALSDISARKRKEAYRGIDREILQILNESGDRQDFIGRVLATLKARTGFDAVGIRLQDGDDFPYFVQEGFSEQFLRTENSLVERAADGGLCRDKDGRACLECTCGLVLSGLADPTNPLFTKGGSCWTNDSRALLDVPPGEDPRHHPRNRCIHFGYASVALVPIRMQHRIAGLIQLNDRREGCFTLETVEILEGIAWHIGEALLRKKTEDERNEALRRAEAAAVAKSEFLGVMSHELRTPLNGVLGFTELLAETPLNEEQKSFAKTISRSGEHLLSVVNDILDFSSIEHGSMTIQPAPFAIADLVKSSDDAVRQAAADKGIGFRCEVAAGVPEQITGDERRIRQILINILGNAVKFTPGGSVVLRIAPDPEGRFLEFSVEDTGIGISAETIGGLFKPFTQANSTTSRRFGGTGLGLAISKRLAEAMCGTLTVASTPGKGSTFTLRLPLDIPDGGMGAAPSHLSIAAASPSSPGAEASVAPEGKLVLVADDEPKSTVLAEKMLQGLGYRVEIAADGEEALKAFVPGKFSAILMDMAMPVMDGIEATKMIREAEANTGSHVPIIAFTANVMPSDRARCLAAGMDDFLTKPFKRAELAAKLAAVTRPL
jgi:PAS domain S-box-containing protein